jgi:hypothetical protein
MNLLSVALLAATAAILSAIPAKSDPVDMSTVTCAQLLGMKQDEVTFMLVWTAGYLAGTAEELSMDPDALGQAAEKTVTYCQANQEMSVLNAAKESVGE